MSPTYLQFMKYSCHVYNNFIWFWYDLHGPNPDWRCFQQNYRGVVFYAEMKVLQMSWNFLTIFLEQKRPPKFCGRVRRATRTAQRTRRPWGTWLAPVGCAHLEAHLRVKPTPKNLINRETIRNNPRSEVSPPQASVATKNQSRPVPAPHRRG